MLIIFIRSNEIATIIILNSLTIIKTRYLYNKIKLYLTFIESIRLIRLSILII
jgi:hypothetical protein